MRPTTQITSTTLPAAQAVRLVSFALLATLITVFAGSANAASIPVTNAGFEYPAGPVGAGGVIDNLLDGSDPLTGWTKQSGGQIYNPGNDANAPQGNNSYLILDGIAGYNTGSGSILQVLGDVLKVGDYTLSVQVGENATATSSFGTSYSVEFGVMNGTTFVQLASESSLAPNNGFLTSNVPFTADAIGDAANLGLPLAIQLTGNVAPLINNQVLFDDVQLDFVAAPTDVTVYLQAQRFDKEIPGNGSVPMWGFASCDSTFTTCASPTETDAPGPRIDAFAGHSLTIKLKNTLPVPVSIMIPGQANAGLTSPAAGRLTAFAEPTAAGATVEYSWASLKSGTYLYQSATYPSLEVPMGLYGAVVVNVDGTTTYAGVVNDAEAMLLFSEIDPIQNLRVDNASQGTPTALPTTACVPYADYARNMTGGYPCTLDYNPMYMLVNGEASITLPAGQPGEQTLLRFLNAGLNSHTPSIVGVELNLIAEDGNRYPGRALQQSGALLAAGKTLDALVTLPGSDITLSLFDRMPSFSNENLPNGGSLGGVVVGGGSLPTPPPTNGAGNDGPYAVTEDTDLPVAAPGVLGNDTNKTPVSLTVVSGPANGNVVLSSNGSFTYTPNADYSGPDSFTYNSDGELAKVTLSVSFVNDRPVANGDGPFVNAIGADVNVAAPGVLGNDQDVDGDTLTAVLEGTAPGLTLNANGSFVYTGGVATTFSYRADDGTVTSDPVVVTLSPNPVAGIQLTVEDALGATLPPEGYRWTVEEEAMWQPDPDATTLPFETLATSFHKSHMPIVAQGIGASELAQVALDPAKHYYVSVLPLDAASATGHTIGGARIPPGVTDVIVFVNNDPLPTAQISIFIFEDSSPTNGAVDGNETGLGGFQVTLEEAGGRYGISGGTMSQDVFGDPLTNALDCFGGALPAPGIILSCPDTPENQANEVVGEVLIKNLYQGKYGIIVTPPLSTANDWIETTTIEGTPVIDAWVKAGEPAFFQEFGPAGWHVFAGFVNPARLQANNPGGGNLHKVSGHVTNWHMSRPPDQELHDSTNYDALAHTQAYVGINSAGGNGDNYDAVLADPDGYFTISGIPNGDYQLVVWDKYLDQVIAYRAVTLAGADVDVTSVPVFQWFARTEHNVFLDDGCGDPLFALDGIRQDCEAPIPEQAINLRWRDGTVNQSFPTDSEGFVPFDETFPFFHWLVQEVDFTRFKATGLTVTVDGGGDVTGTGFVLNPQAQGPCTQDDVDNGWNGCVAVGAAYTNSYQRTETGPVLTQGFQGFLGQTSIFDWGKAPYAKDENGGISGIVYYASTRAENDPRLSVGEPWEPGVPSAKVRLYREVARDITSIPVTNPSFEIPAGGNGVLDDVVDGTNGWVKTGSGQIYNPGLNENAFDGDNSYLILNFIAGYDNGDGSIQQVLADTLSVGSYTLSVAVGENATDVSVFGSYQVQLGVMDTDGTTFVVLAEDNNTLAPSNGFLTSTVQYTASAKDANLDQPLAIRLVGTVVGPSPNTQVLFDDVRLDFANIGLALVQETETDSWDKSPPEGCPGADLSDVLIVGGPVDGAGLTTKCYDGLRNFNQARPGVFDGGYAFAGIPPGKYIVELIPPPGYSLVKEEDNNVGFGDTYSNAPVAVALPGGALALAVPDAAMVLEAMSAEPGLAQPRCVGEVRAVPLYLELFPGEMVEAPFATADRPLCDRKEVFLPDQGQAAADFFVFTAAPIAGHFVGMILDDVAQEFNPLSPQFGEKWAPPFVPVSVRDHLGREVSRLYSDQWGRMNGLVPSTFSANMPSPSGYSPAMLMTCMNDPGPIPDPNNPGAMIVDPQFNPAYSNFCYTFQYMPGTTTYLDTPVLPVSAFASGYNPPDCAPEDATPRIRQVNGSGDGPLTTGDGTLTIYSQGVMNVPNPAYEGPLATGIAGQKTITRNFGFGGAGTVTLNGVAATNVTWRDDTITVDLGGQFSAGAYQLAVTNANGATTEAVTVEVRATNYKRIRVPADYPTIQAAIDAATTNPGDLILVSPGVYDELVIMWKPVRLQGAGAGSTIINAVKRPTEKLVAWRAKMDCLFGIGAGCTQVVNALPNQGDGAIGFDTEEGAAVTVVGPFDTRSGGGRPANRFAGRQSRIDGFSITGGDTGGGIFVNGYAHQLAIGNNRVFGNSGSYHGGIRVGRPYLELEPLPAGNGGAPARYAFNDQVSIHHNAVTQNGGLEGAGGGLSIATGTDRYNVSENFVCGNFTVGDGGGIGHLGLSDNGVIAHNRLMFNQSFNQAQTVSGGGLFIGGEPGAAGALTLGSGDVVVDANLIQGNQAGAGHGGGIRTQFVNGQEIPNSNNNNGNPRFGQWFRIDVTNNMIVNNVAGWSGGGISMQDTARSFVINNTIAHNDSTSTAGPIVIGGNTSDPLPAGVSSELHSPGLAAAIPVRNNTADLRFFSNPTLSNNIVWENRSFSYDATTGTAKLLPELTPGADGCDSGATYWDLGVNTGAYLLSPTNSVLSSTIGTVADASNTTNDPLLAGAYCNRDRASADLPMQALPALDEGGAGWIDVRFGPLVPGGDYHISTDSSAIDIGSAITAPARDFDNDVRPQGIADDIGADEFILAP